MNNFSLGMINKGELASVKNELIRRREILISFAHDPVFKMEKLDRECIVSFFEKWQLPKRPNSIPDLMKTFFTCCFTYAPLRKYLTNIAGGIPTPSMLPGCLSQIYDQKDFLNDEIWYPDKLHKVAMLIQKKEQFKLKSNQFKPRMIAVILDGTKKMGFKLNSGLDTFYDEVQRINLSPGDQIWKYVSAFPKNIYNVGPALICDFLKDLGFENFVKVDHHFKNEFPELIGFDNCRKLSSKEHFILSLELAKFIKMSPFHLDHLLYQWGRYKKFEN